MEPSKGPLKNYITPTGAAKLKEELKELLHKARPELVKVVAWAASNGDRSENGDYLYGKRKLREIDRRIRFLQGRLEAAEIIDPATQPVDRVRFGVEVTVQGEDEVKRKYRIVGVDEAVPAQGWVSWISPLAKALLNLKVGDTCLFRSPKDPEGEELEVIAISRILGETEAR